MFEHCMFTGKLVLYAEAQHHDSNLDTNVLTNSIAIRYGSAKQLLIVVRQNLLQLQLNLRISARSYELVSALLSS